MAQPQQNVSLVSPGFAGLNTQDSPLSQDYSYASIAENCVIDQLGRIGGRNGFQGITTNPEVLNGNPIKAMYEFVTTTGVTYLFACGDNKIFIQQTVAPFELVELVLPGGYAITEDNWKIQQFNTLDNEDACFFAQTGHAPLVFKPASSPTALFEAIAPQFAVVGNYPNEVHAAFGRLWYADFENDNTVIAWSGLLNGEDWLGAGTGSLQTEEYWPSGFDSIRGLAAHNNFMCIFGERNILVYTTTSDVVSTLRLVDTIEGIGCIARDSLVPTGVDYMFIDSTGLRSLNRTIQEKSVPIGDMSRNVRQDFQFALKNEPQDDIKAVFHVEDNFYVTFLPSNPITYVFDTWQLLPPERAARATTWTNIDVTCGTRTLDRVTYFGGVGGVYEYTGTVDINPLDGGDFKTIYVRYYTQPLDFNDPASLIFPKQVDVTFIGADSGKLYLKWAYDYREIDGSQLIEKDVPGGVPASEWGGVLAKRGGEWNDQVALWSAASQVVKELKYNIWGSGRNIKLGFEADTIGGPISFQELNVQVLQGKLL